MNMTYRFLMLLALVATSAGLLAQDQTVAPSQETNAPKYSNEFLRIGVGARAFGMGNAQVAIAEDVTAGYWNPAGLASPNAIQYPEVSLMHASYFANVAQYSYLGFSMPVDSSAKRYFSATLIRLGVDEIPNTLNLIEPDGSINYDNLESFSESSFAALFSYAWVPDAIPGLSLGTNFKIVYRGVGRFANAWGFGLDLAARYKIKNFSAGINVTDITNTINAWTFNTETFEDAFIKTGNTVPQNSIELTRPSVRTGIGYDFKLAKRMSLLVALDGDLYFDGNRSSAVVSGGGVSLEPRGGLELAWRNRNYRKVAFVRGGFYNIQNLTNEDGQEALGIFPTAGLGFLVKNFQIDYALANIGSITGSLYTHVVSLKFHVQ